MPIRGHLQVAISPDATITTLSPEQTLAAGQYDISGVGADGKPFHVPARFTFVFMRKDGAMHIVHSHSSVQPKPQ